VISYRGKADLSFSIPGACTSNARRYSLTPGCGVDEPRTSRGDSLQRPKTHVYEARALDAELSVRCRERLGLGAHPFFKKLDINDSKSCDEAA
jgi:hypothetical protein